MTMTMMMITTKQKIFLLRRLSDVGMFFKVEEKIMFHSAEYNFNHFMIERDRQYDNGNNNISATKPDDVTTVQMRTISVRSIYSLLIYYFGGKINPSSGREKCCYETEKCRHRRKIHTNAFTFSWDRNKLRSPRKKLFRRQFTQLSGSQWNGKDVNIVRPHYTDSTTETLVYFNRARQTTTIAISFQYINFGWHSADAFLVVSLAFLLKMRFCCFGRQNNKQSFSSFPTSFMLSSRSTSLSCALDFIVIFTRFFPLCIFECLRHVFSLSLFSVLCVCAHEIISLVLLSR